MQNDDSLESEIERLYATFAQYQGDLTDRSPYAGITDADVTRLQSRPLRQLTTADLDRYVRSALTTWGGVEEFKHFLPRIFELLVRRPGVIDPLVLGKLEAAEWRTWSSVEQGAVDGYLDALWRWALSVNPDVIDASDLLRGIGLADQDVGRWIDVWRDDRSRTATEQIAHFVALIGRDLSVGDLPSHWHPKVHDAVLAFLAEGSTQARIEAMLIDYPEGESGRTLATAVDVLANIPR